MLWIIYVLVHGLEEQALIWYERKESLKQGAGMRALFCNTAQHGAGSEDTNNAAR